MDTFEKEKAERRLARQAKIDAQMKAMERAMGAADASYRNFVVNMEDAELERSVSSRDGMQAGDDSSASIASADSGASPNERRANAINMARSFLNDEDGGYSSRNVLSDPEFAHADASGRLLSPDRGGPRHRVAPRSASSLIGHASTSLRNVAGEAQDDNHNDADNDSAYSASGRDRADASGSVNALMGRAGESLVRVVGGVAGRLHVGQNHQQHRQEQFNGNSSDRSFRADNLHNLSAGLENYSDPYSQQQKQQHRNSGSSSFSSRTKDDKRTSHLRDDDADDGGLMERLEWSCIRLSNKLETVCFHRRCLLLMVAATIVVAIIVAALTTSSAFEGRLPHISFGGESEEEFEAQNERYVKIRDRILFAEASEPASLESKGATPQSYALEWIVREDPAQIDPEDPYLLQRYALAVFWYQLRTDKTGKLTADTKWKDDSNWMTELGYCSWYGVHCYPQDGMPKDTQYDGNNIILELNLTRNELKSDEMPKEIYTTLEGLQNLDISHNKIGGSIATEIGRLTALKGLYIGDNSFQGSIVTELMQLTRLMNVFAHKNLLSGKIPEEIGNLVNLYALGLHENELEGTIPSSIGKCTKLRNLYLDQNQLDGSIPEDIYNLSLLADLRLRSNKLTGPISEKIGNLGKLELLYLDNNLLSSTIPRGIGNLGSRLEELHLQGNELEGRLEVEIGRLSRLKELYLSSNRLTSTIPLEWGELRDLKQLFLSENSISGTIPIEITGMEFLVALQLQSNSLEGTIPTELGKMFRLEYLHMENNNLEGTVPTHLGQLVHLEKLTLHGNGLKGQVPDEVCNLVLINNLAEFVTDCAGANAAVQCFCCSDCV